MTINGNYDFGTDLFLEFDKVVFQQIVLKEGVNVMSESCLSGE